MDRWFLHSWRFVSFVAPPGLSTVHILESLALHLSLFLFDRESKSSRGRQFNLFVKLREIRGKLPFPTSSDSISLRSAGSSEESSLCEASGPIKLREAGAVNF